MLWIGPISDQERTNPSSSARTIAAAAPPMNRLRECSVGARVLGDEGVRPRSRGVRELRRLAVEASSQGPLPSTRRECDCSPLRSAWTIWTSTAVRSSSIAPDPAQRALVLGRRAKSKAVVRRWKPEAAERRSGSPGRGELLLCRPRPCSVPGRLLPEVSLDPLGEQPLHLARIAPKLAVGGGPRLERPERIDTLVGLPEEPKPEHRHDDDEQRRPDEGDEQLGVNPGRDAPDSPDQRIAGRAQQPTLPGTSAAASWCATEVRRHLLRSSARSCRRRSS